MKKSVLKRWNVSLQKMRKSGSKSTKDYNNFREQMMNRRQRRRRNWPNLCSISYSRTTPSVDNTSFDSTLTSHKILSWEKERKEGSIRSWKYSRRQGLWLRRQKSLGCLTKRKSWGNIRSKFFLKRFRLISNERNRPFNN